MLDARIPTALMLAALLASCTDNPSTIAVTQLERGGDLDFVCLCTDADGIVSGAAHDACDPETGDEDCDPYVLLMQRNRGEIAVVDIMHRDLHDSDRRAPFVTFPHVGEFPSSMAVAADGRTVWVVHMGEPTLAQVETSGLLGPTLPAPVFHDLPGKGYAIALSDDGQSAFVSLPEQGALAVVDLSVQPPAVTTFDLNAPVTPEEPDPEPAPDADAMDAPGDPVDADDDADAPADVPPDGDLDGGPDVPGEDPPVTLPTTFTPLDVQIVESRGSRGRIFVSGFDEHGGGGVVELDVESLLDGGADPLIATYITGTPVSRIAVAHVEPVEGELNGAPRGDFLYAADRDEPLLHVVDLATSEEIDTTGGNPLVSGGAIRTDGLVQDVVVVEFVEEDGIPPEYSIDDMDPTDWHGVFVFAATSAGVVHAVDVYDRYCYHLLDEEEQVQCTPHVLRNALPRTDSAPFWSEPPTLTMENGETKSLSTCAAGYPCFADFTGTAGTDSSYGVTFYPDLPGEEIPADIRRPRSEIWTVTWEGVLLWSTGIGGNLSGDGSVLTDPGLPFCAIGVRGEGDGYPGDVLVVEDGPSPLDDSTDCDAWPAEGGMAYRIVRATQNELTLEPVSQWSPETTQPTWLSDADGDLPPYPLPTEECFPFAVRYHVRTSGMWTVTGSRTGFLHSTTLDAQGRCVDSSASCASWDEYDGSSGCTLRRGRAHMDEVFVNPYLRFEVSSEGIPWGEGGGRPDGVMVPGMGFSLPAASGFVALSEWVSALPDSMAYLDHVDLFYISDRGYDGLVELDPDSFRLLYSYD